MRCTKIHFRGYKRLAETHCYVGQRLLAFVGMNEAGKTSVLEGLEWLTEDEETPLERHDRSRANPVAQGWVVGAEFKLSKDDRALLEPLGFERVPAVISVWKQADGTKVTVFREPRDPRRHSGPFVEALEAIERAEGRLKKQYELADEEWREVEEAGPRHWTELVKIALKDPDSEWSEDLGSQATLLADWFDEVPEGLKTARAVKAAELLRVAAERGSAPHPKDAGAEVLGRRIPKFVAFRETDRLIPTRTAIDDAHRPEMAPAIRNILSIAGVDAARLWLAQEDPTTGEAATICGNGNDRLDEFFGEAWNQSEVSLHLSADADGLLTHVLNLNNKRRTSLEERSEGLRAFLALAAFLRAQDFAVPPILLIDEAERHLHLDAQADLVGVLMKQVEATQIFYSTHSPGCLPSDLGTGIRLVDRVDQESSKLKTHFWTNSPPGLGSLLYAMGASAAAFSAFRWAVLAEGATEMVLLPTLLRHATGVADLGYQVAPGLAVRRSDDFEVEEIAAKVAYLADGDRDGKKYVEDLKRAGVDESRVFTLPDRMATEDLLDPDYYLSIVSEVLGKASPKPERSDLVSRQPYATSIKRWAERVGAVEPGKVAVAYRALEDQHIRLAPGADQVLRDLHSGFLRAFNAKPDGTSDQ